MAKKNKNNGTQYSVKEESRPEEVREKPKREMSETELLANVDNAINNALGKLDTKLSNQRLQAMKYYLGDKVGNLAPPEAEGRSSVVSTDLSDTIEWILPSLIKIFVSGEDSIEFNARKEEDIQAAQDATDGANYVLHVQNEGFIILHDWFKDALLQKLGVIKTWWDDSKDITTEEYEGLSLEELTIMLQDGTVEVIQQTKREVQPTQGVLLAFQQMAAQPQTPGQAPPQPPAPSVVYDVKVKRTANSAHICIENVPPEEFLFSRKARTAQRIFDCHHRVLRTVTELKEAGYKNTDDLMNDDNGAEFSQETIERNSDTEGWTQNTDSDNGDPSMRFVWITESYMQIDWNNDGLAEWRKIVKSGKTLLSNDEIDEHPFSMLTPIKMPHKLVGRSVADLLMDLMDIKTALWRQFIDNMYLQNNPRQYVDTTKGVNIDDLLDSRVGGIVRGKGENGVTPLAVAPLSPYTFNLLEYMDNVKADRTGVNDTSKGLDADTLNDASNNNRNQLVSAAAAKIELIARIFAETGVKDLFKKILKLSGQYQNQAQTIRLTGNKFKPIDPRTWKTQYDISINVGLGNGNKDQMAGHITNIMNIQEQCIAGGLPIVSAKQIYNAAKKLVLNSGFKNADAFFVDPTSPEGQQLAQQQSQKPNPDAMKAQAEMQQMQAEFQLKAQDSQTKNEVQKANDERDFQRQQQKDQNDYNLRLTEIQAQRDAKREELALTAQLKREEMDRKYEQERINKLMDHELQLKMQDSTHQHESNTRNSLSPHESGTIDVMKGMADASINGMSQIAAALASGGDKKIKINRMNDGSMVGEVTAQG